MSARKATPKGKRKQSAQTTHSAPVPADTNASVPRSENVETKAAVAKAAVTSLVDFPLVLSLVFGGCCANVWSYESLLKMNAQLGTTLTFSQMVFITLHSLPSFITWSGRSSLPRLKPRQVPFARWAAQVLVLTTGSLLNNWAYAYNVPLTVQIVFRSAGTFPALLPLHLINAQLSRGPGLAVSMLFGYAFMKKRYSVAQIAAVVFVSIGVVVATLSRPSSPHASDAASPWRYSTGVLMLTVSLLLTGVLGMLQELTYSKYGPCWKEGVFYTHFLSLPIFLFLTEDIKAGFHSLAKQPASAAALPALFAPLVPYIVLAANLVTQLICVSGVNQLTSRVSSVSTNLVLTTRKAISLCFSVWWFGNGWNTQLGAGAGMVFLGSLLYTLVSGPAGSGSVSSTRSPRRLRKKKVQ
ncbi:hypothetical protein CERSUDRAFT_47843 [Gelatoporia subvermispora B]|uniref:Sugar phosphate transporter domain-containing protein n=1 Tax=Ceriporiopsis subvermispora (strain B) TaxID=914234 RepID=M2QP71_CERS8|nr:hypothetical protein CERSUDRAFT_47843 [Gelatoporia subvermispora B]